MRNDAGLKIADVVGSVMDELNVSHAALMRLLEPLQLLLEEVEPLYVTHDGRLPCFMCGFEIGRRKCATQAMIGDHLIHPVEASKMVLVQLTRFRHAQRAETTTHCHHMRKRGMTGIATPRSSRRRSRDWRR